VRLAVRARHLSRHTAHAYGHWIKHFKGFHHERPVADLSEPDLGRFSSSWATVAQVSASTHNHALNTLLCLYHDVLEIEIGLVQGAVRAMRANRLPVVLTREEVRRLIGALRDTLWLMAMVMYGGGLRLSWNAAACASRIASAPATKSSCAAVKARRTGIRRCRPPPAGPFCDIFEPCSGSTRKIGHKGRAG
jgi:integrase